MSRQVLVPSRRAKGGLRQDVIDQCNANFAELYAGGAEGYDGSSSGLSATTLQAAIDETLSKRVAPYTLLSIKYGLVGDNSTDNNTPILAWIAAANAAIALGLKVSMILTPGRYRTTGRHVFPGDADITFQSAELIASGSDDTTPTFQHGSAAATTGGSLFGISISSVVSHSFTNPNCVAIRLTNKWKAHHHVLTPAGHVWGVQFAGEDGAAGCAYNTLLWSGAFNCIHGLGFINRGLNTFVSENTVMGGDVENGEAVFGNHYGATLMNDYDTGHADHSGNNWYNPSFQVGAPGTAWSAGATLVANRRYRTNSIGGEWLCKTGGVAGSVEPSIIPAFVSINVITLVQGSAIVTMASTSGVSAGMHVRGTNPTDAFPLDTYVQSVDSATQLTLTKTASRASTTYKGIFTATTADNAATLVFLGPYRRSAVWLRSVGIGNGAHDCRLEAITGEAILNSGVHLWPPSATSGLGNFKLTARNISNLNTMKRSYHPVWEATHTYAIGDMTRPTVSNGTYWDCIVPGDSAGTEPATPATTPGTIIIDGGVTWIVKPYQVTGLVGDYTNSNAGGSSTKWRITCGYSSEPATASATLDNLNLRAVGSAAGWLVKGFCKMNQFGGAPVSNFAAADLVLMRDGLLLAQNNILYGAYLRTSRTKAFTVRTLFGAHALGRGYIACYDANLVQLNMTAAQNAYHRRFQGDFGFDGSTALAKAQSDGGGALTSFFVNDEVEYVFLGNKKSNNCTLAGFSVTEMPQSFTPGSVQLLTFKGNDNGPRMALGVPTSGYFQAAGEYIINASATDGGAVKGWRVKTAGVLAPAWAGTSVVLKGQLVTNGGNVYAANGSFTTGTAPTGTTANIADGTATSITAGDVASWDFVSAVAVLTADEDTDAVYALGNGGATPTPNCANGLTQTITMNANATVGAPTNPPQVGSELTLVFTQDGTGSRTIAWNATYRNAPAWSAGAASTKATARFTYDGTSWQFIGGSTAFA